MDGSTRARRQSKNHGMRRPGIMTLLLVLRSLDRTSALHRPVTPSRLRADVKMQSDAFSMASLNSRVEQVCHQATPEAARLLMLDAMVPRQRYQLAAPAQLVQTIVDSQHAGTPLVMVEPHWPNLYTWNEPAKVWRPHRRQEPASHGVEVSIAAMGPRGAEGDAIVTLEAGRWCEVVSVSAVEGSVACGCPGTVRWRALDAREPEEQPTPAVLSRSEALGEQARVWADYVRAIGSEASVAQLESRMLGLGEMPPADRPSDRALWVAGLINPCPSGASGTLALEVRPAALNAPAAEARVRVVQAALVDSIDRLRDLCDM